MTSSPARDPNMLIAQALNQALAGEKKNIPTWNGQPGTLRSWLKLLALWEHESQLPLERRGVKLLQSFVEGSGATSHSRYNPYAHPFESTGVQCSAECHL